MLRDADARLLFVDATAMALMPDDARPRCIALEAGAPGTPFDDWLAAPGTRPLPVTVPPESPFNLIYSSGTTGDAERHRAIACDALDAHVSAAQPYGYGA